MLIAEKLSLARTRAGLLLAERVRAECESLRLAGADFVVHSMRLPESRWSALGWDHVVFEATTTPGLDLRPLARIASGGELSRFALALQVAGSKSRADCLIFDEIDAAVGGGNGISYRQALASTIRGAPNFGCHP